MELAVRSLTPAIARAVAVDSALHEPHSVVVAVAVAEALLEAGIELPVAVATTPYCDAYEREHVIMLDGGRAKIYLNVISPQVCSQGAYIQWVL